MIVSGLEINDSKLRILSLKKSNKSLKILSYGEKDIPPGVIVNGEVKEVGALYQAISQLKKETRPKKTASPYVILTLPENVVYLTSKEFPSLEEAHLKEAVELNFNEFLPGDPKDIYWGWQDSPDNKNKEIILASARKDLLKNYLEAILGADFLPIAIEPSSLAATRAFAVVPKGILLVVEPAFVTAVILEGKKVLWGTAASINKENFDEELVNFARKILNFHKSEKKLTKTEILLSGSKSSSEVGQLLANNCQVRVRLAQSDLIFFNDAIKSPVVIGAALRGLLDQKDDRNLSLLPVGAREAYEEKRVLRFFGGLVNITAITCLLFVLIFAGFWALQFYLRQLDDQELTTLSGAKIDPQTSKVQKEIAQFAPQIDTLKSWLNEENAPSPLLKEIRQVASQEIAINNISWAREGDPLNINGIAQSNQALSVFKSNLEKSKDFDKVTLSSTNSAEGQTISFSVSLKLNSAGLKKLKETDGTKS